MTTSLLHIGNKARRAPEFEGREMLGMDFCDTSKSDWNIPQLH